PLDDGGELLDGLEVDDVHRASGRVPGNECDAVGVDIELEVDGVHGSRLLGIGLARPAQEAHAVGVPLHDEIAVRIVAALGTRARADLEIKRVALRSVDEVVAVRDAGLEARAVARLEQRLTAVLDQGNLAFEHEDELVLLLVPVAQRRGGARLEPREIDAELGEPRDVAERRLLAAVGHFAPGLRVDALGAHHGLGDVDLGHAHTRSMMVAVPMPAPMHSVTSAVSRLLRSSSSIAVPRIMAPVAPSGWPIAIAPPLTLTFLGSSLNACRKRSTTAAKASLT